MKKFSDIFNIDTSKGGGKRLIKKIINKYRLGNEYKEIKENIESKGGSSGEDEVWYMVSEDVESGLIRELRYVIINVVTYCHEWEYGGYRNIYDSPLFIKDSPSYVVYGISFRNIKTNIAGTIYEYKGNNTIEDIINANINEYTTEILNELKPYLKLSTKEEIEKYMNEQLNQ